LAVVAVVEEWKAAVHAHPYDRNDRFVLSSPSFDEAELTIICLFFLRDLTGMTLGFILRLAYRNTPYSLGLYAIQMLFILLSVRLSLPRRTNENRHFLPCQPCAFLATDYLLLKHLAVSMGPDVVKNCLFLPIGVIVKLFVFVLLPPFLPSFHSVFRLCSWCDVITFVVQAAGGGASATKGDFAKIGPKIALAGLIIQLVSFGLFTLLLLIFAYRVFVILSPSPYGPH
jgi:hypothetical protein